MNQSLWCLWIATEFANRLEAKGNPHLDVDPLEQYQNRFQRVDRLIALFPRPAWDDSEWMAVCYLTASMVRLKACKVHILTNP